MTGLFRDMMGVDEQCAVALMQMFDQNKDGSLDWDTWNT